MTPLLKSIRLQGLRDYYQESEIIWDVGCDHGLLGLSFLEEPKVKEIHLVDPSELVVEELKKKVKDSYITNGQIFIHHQKGQDIKLQTPNNTIFIAGMGGSEISDIISCLLPQLTAKDRLIISPHRKIFEVRSYLAATPLKCLGEKLIEENGQFYQILALGFSSDKPSVSPFGEEIWNGEVGEKYRRHQLSFFNLHQDQASKDYVAYLRKISFT